ncbi:MAG TPA: YbaK/EbsC family protein [Candidatus Limnocylindrales bacterium]
MIDWLKRNGVEYEIHEHRASFTARETARADGVEPTTFAKVVGVVTGDGRQAMLVLDATDQLDLRKARKAIETGHVRLMTEDELAQLAAGCDVGALPALGALFGLPMYADYAVRDDREISFNAGSHLHSVRVDRLAWERASGVVYADLAEDYDRRPAWSRS